MAELKTKPSDGDVEAFLSTVTDAQRQQDCRVVLAIMRRATGFEPKLWGTSLVGFGSWHYKYESGREGDTFLTGFAPRKDSVTVYLTSGIERHAALLSKLGKHKTGKGCLYIKKLADVDLQVLEQLIGDSIQQLARA